METDIIARLTGRAAAAALAHRPDLMAASRRNECAIVTPDEPGGLSHDERRSLARRIALLNGNADLAAYYAESELAIEDNARWTAILRHVDLVTTRPKDAARADIDRLRNAGVSEPDIVRLSQVIAFVNYQVRVIAGVRLIAA
jgi:uncharacterized protein YciW